MPVDLKRYPKNWKEISLRIKERSGWQCECLGECGLHKTSSIRRCCEKHGEKAKWAKGKVILTVAHLGTDYPNGTKGDPHDKMDVRDENLKAMCQRCHLRYDLDEHIKNRKRTLEARKWNNQMALNLSHN